MKISGLGYGVNRNFMAPGRNMAQGSPMAHGSNTAQAIRFSGKTESGDGHSVNRESDRAHFAQLVKSLSPPMAEVIVRGQSKAQEVGNYYYNPLHILYGILDVVLENLNDLTAPAVPGARPKPAQEWFNALFPDYSLESNKGEIKKLLTSTREIVSSYLSDSELMGTRGSSRVLREHTELVPIDKNLCGGLAIIGQSEAAVPTTLALLKSGATCPILKDYPKGSMIGSRIKQGFTHASEVLSYFSSENTLKNLAKKADPAEAANKSAAAEQEEISTEAFENMIENLSPTLDKAYKMAEHIAQNAYANTINPEHMVLGMLRMVNEFVALFPKMVNASPDQVPKEIKIDGVAHYPKAMRILLDSIIPAEARDGLTAAQIKSMFSGAEATLDKMVYKHGKVLREKGTDPEPSVSLKNLINRVNNDHIDTPNHISAFTGNYPYAFMEAMRHALPESSRNEDKALGALLKKLVEEAEKKSALIPNVKFEDIGGFENVRRELLKFIDMNMRPEFYAKFGITKDKIQRGAILYGPPGTGKTYFAKAVANKMNVPFFAVNGSDFVKKYAGTGPEEVHKLFQEAKKHPKSLIFIDEADALLATRSNNGDSASKEHNNTLNAFLTEMDGIEDNSGIIVIAATNRMDKLDPAAIRPGRLGKHINVPLPDKDDRLAVLKVHTKGMPLAADCNLAKIANLTKGSSSVAMRDLATEAALFAIEEFTSGRREVPEIVNTDFDEAFDRIHYGPASLRTHNEHDMKVVANHEVLGHGLVAYALDRQLRTLSTVARDKSAGHVSIVPEEGFASDTRNYLLQELLIDVAGQAAETLANGRANVTGGARGDYGQARGMLIHMLQDGIMPGYRATNYTDMSETKLAPKDEALIEFLLHRAMDVAEKMIEVVPKAQRDAMEGKVLKRLEMRWEKATQFYVDHVADAQKEKMKALSDQYVEQVLDLLENRARYNEDMFLNFKKAGEAAKPEPVKFGQNKPNIFRLPAPKPGVREATLA